MCFVKFVYVGLELDGGISVRSCAFDEPELSLHLITGGGNITLPILLCFTRFGGENFIASFWSVSHLITGGGNTTFNFLLVFLLIAGGGNLIGPFWLVSQVIIGGGNLIGPL